MKDKNMIFGIIEAIRFIIGELILVALTIIAICFAFYELGISGEGEWPLSNLAMAIIAFAVVNRNGIYGVHK